MSVPCALPEDEWLWGPNKVCQNGSSHLSESIPPRSVSHLATPNLVERWFTPSVFTRQQLVNARYGHFVVKPLELVGVLRVWI